MKKSTSAVPVVCDLQEAARRLDALRVTHAAALRATLPEALGAVILHQVDDLAALRREANALGAMLVTGRDAAAASRMVAKLNRGGLLARVLPAAKAEEERPTLSPDIEDALRNEMPPQEPVIPAAPAESPRAPLSPDIDDALEHELPIPQAEDIPAAPVMTDASAQPAPAAQSLPTREGAAFILLIDSLECVPSLAELPGAQPDLVIVSGVTGDDAAAGACLAEIIACGTDAEFAQPADACSAAQVAQAEGMRASLRTADRGQIAVMMLRRGATGGYAARLTDALCETYPIAPCRVVSSAVPALRRVLASEVNTVPPLPELRLRDMDRLLLAIRRAKTAKKLTDAQLRQVIASMRVQPEDRHDLDDLLARQRALFASGVTLPVDFRLKQLRALLVWIDTHEAQIEAALKSDLGKCAFEAYETEILLVKEELRTFIRHLPAWQRDCRAASPIVHFPSRCRTVRNPYGLALIMSPWNYPFLLSVDPLIAAIGGGNCVVLKPSAYAPATSALLKEMADTLFDPEFAAVIEGGRRENQALLEKKFDTIFFTGSVGVGKVVMKAAAEHLTPVTLELGGKSPCIVDATADIPLAAKRIAWGKFINAGQTCVAPDYVLCHASVRDRLVEELRKAIRRYYGKDPLTNPELCHIINQTHFERLCGLMIGMETAIGGQVDAATRKIEPTVLTNVTWDDPVMQEEIFGPILPILAWDGEIDDLIPAIEARPRPLAAYLFTRDKHAEEQFLRRLRFGGGCVNDVLCHLATSSMPFGGVGESGMGHYHGKYGFDTFTHLKSILKKSRWIDLPIRYAPYGERKIKLLRKL